MNEILKRLTVVYLGFTAALWAISYGMVSNGSAYPGNFAWGIVTGLRFYFSLPIALLLAVAGSAGLFWVAQEARECRWAAHAAREQAERDLRETEVRQRKAEKENRLEAERMAMRIARESETSAEAKRRKEEREREKAIEKQARSASAAAERALDDF